MSGSPRCLLLLLLVLALNLSTRADSLVRVDPRIELMTVVQLLSGYPTLTQLDSSYRRDVTNYFDPYRNHHAVRLYAEMSRDHFAYDAVPRAVLCFSLPPDFRPIGMPGKKTVRRAGGKARLDDFMRALQEFARASNFAAFSKAHESDYARVEAALCPDVDASVKALRAYTGLPFTNCQLIAGMLIHNGGFQATVETKTAPLTYAIIGPFGLANDLPVFSSNGSVSYVAQHEFSHSFVNPFVEKNSAAVGRYSRLFNPIKKEMAKLAYADWETAVHEHIVRAIVIRLAYLRNAQPGDRILANEEKQGFRYVRALVARLKEYEAARDRYPTITPFLPRLLTGFEEFEL